MVANDENCWKWLQILQMIANKMIANGQRDHYVTGCRIDYHYFKDYYKIIIIDLNKQQALDDDPKAIR